MSSLQDPKATSLLVRDVSTLQDENAPRPSSSEHESSQIQLPITSASTARRLQAPPREMPYSSKRQRHAVQSIREVFRWWWLEMLACSASLAALAAEVAILRRYDGQPQGSWPYTTLTLNGLIALLATISRGCLMVSVASVLGQSKWTRFANQRAHPLSGFALFDEASRGSWGSLLVLWEFRGLCHWTCIGAFVTVASLAMSTFSQQVIALETGTNVTQDTSFTPGQASHVARAINILPIFRTGADPAGGLSTTMSLAISNGLLAERIPQLPISCRTADCWWPPIPTIGFCGNCANTTDDVKVIKTPYPRPDSTYTIQKAVLPNGLTVGNVNPNGRDVLFSMASNGTGRAFNRPELDHLKTEKDNVLVQFTALKRTTQLGRLPLLAEATECAIWICIQARDVDVRAGFAADTVAEALHKAVTDHDVAQNGTNSNNDDVKHDFRFVDLPRSFNVLEKQKYDYQVDGRHTRWLTDTLQPYFVGNVTQDTTGIPEFSATHLEGLLNSFNDTSAWMGRVTESMTNGLREGPGNGYNQVLDDGWFYNGFASEEVVTINVRWGWLAYPATLIVISILYLAAEIARTSYLRKTKGARPWKSDPLVPLYASLELDKNVLSAAVAGLERPCGLQSELGEFYVRLDVRENEGLSLSGKLAADDSSSGYERVEQSD